MPNKNITLPEGSIKRAHTLLAAIAVQLELEYPGTTRQQWMVVLAELARNTNEGKI